MCEEHAVSNAEINAGCQQEGHSNKRLEGKPPKMSAGSEKCQVGCKLCHFRTLNAALGPEVSKLRPGDHMCPKERFHPAHRAFTKGL